MIVFILNSMGARDTGISSVCDLFCGAGGFSLGFKRAGFRIVAGFDNDPSARASYIANGLAYCYSQDLFLEDAAVDLVRRHSPEIVIGGPPCQDFSQSGSRVECKNSRLLEAFASIAVGVSPRLILMENVPLAQFSRAYENCCRRLGSEGYTLSSITMRAAQFSVPQTGKRMFLIASRDAADFIGVTKTVADLESVQNKDARPVTVRDVLPDIDTEYFYYLSGTYDRQAVYSIDGLAPTILCRNWPIPSSYAKRKNRDLDDAPVSLSRRLTTTELGVVQGFPRDWIWGRNDTESMKLIGNASPPPMAEWIANTLYLNLRF